MWKGDHIPRTLSVDDITGFFVKFFSFRPLESRRRETFWEIPSVGRKLRVQMTLSRPLTVNYRCKNKYLWNTRTIVGSHQGMRVQVLVELWFGFGDSVLQKDPGRFWRIPACLCWNPISRSNWIHLRQWRDKCCGAIIDTWQQHLLREGKGYEDKPLMSLYFQEPRKSALSNPCIPRPPFRKCYISLLFYLKRQYKVNLHLHTQFEFRQTRSRSTQERYSEFKF